MKLNLVFIVFVLFFCGCKKSSKTSTQEFPPNPDHIEQEKYDAIQILKSKKCLIENPDISINGIELRVDETANKIISENITLNQNNDYVFTNGTIGNKITLTQFEGDSKNQFSKILVEEKNLNKEKIVSKNIGIIQTNNGIKLGISKEELVSKLGKCYVPIESTKNGIQLYYYFETHPNSKENILTKNNLPAYSATYTFWKNKLVAFQFGFEYP